MKFRLDIADLESGELSRPKFKLETADKEVIATILQQLTRIMTISKVENVQIVVNDGRKEHVLTVY